MHAFWLFVGIVLPISIGIFLGFRYWRPWGAWRKTWGGRVATLVFVFSAAIIPHVLSWLHAPAWAVIGVGEGGLTGLIAIMVAYGQSGIKRGR